MNNITNVERIIEFSTNAGKANAGGGCWGAFAITGDNEYIDIYSECV